MSSAVIADLWAIVTSAVVCRRLLFGDGYGLGRDMVFTPRQPLSLDALGLGSSAPRAVPVDGLLGLLTSLVDGTWVGRFAVFGVLAVAGCGAHRLGRCWGTPARVAMAGFAVWNPFVIERLALGQWSLLAGYAALPWLASAADRYLEERNLLRLGPVVAWLGLASITPTGGLTATALLVLLGLRRSGGFRLAGVALLLQLPWLLPGMFGAATLTSDPAGVGAFAVRTERPGGPLTTVLGLGGIWDAGSTPASRSGVLGYATTVVFVAALLVGWPVLRRTLGDVATRLAVLAGAAVVLALASSVPGVRGVVRWAVEEIPGAGLLRDSQKWLAPFALFVILSLGAVVQRVLNASSRVEILVVVTAVSVCAPLLLLPDALRTVDPTLTPSRYPPDFAAVARIVDGRGEMVTLPFTSYRRFSWSNGTAVADPASRWFDTDVVVSDALVVGDLQLAGEDTRAERVGAALRSGRLPREVLAENGVRWALVYRDAPGADGVVTKGLVSAYLGQYLDLYRVPGRIGVPPDTEPKTAVAWAVVSVDLLLLAALTAACLVAVAARRRTHGTRSDCYRELGTRRSGTP